jgi:hypothetical protein
MIRGRAANVRLLDPDDLFAENRRNAVFNALLADLIGKLVVRSDADAGEGSNHST